MFENVYEIGRRMTRLESMYVLLHIYDWNRQGNAQQDFKFYYQN